MLEGAHTNVLGPVLGKVLLLQLAVLVLFFLNLTDHASDSIVVEFHVLDSRRVLQLVGDVCHLDSNRNDFLFQGAAVEGMGSLIREELRNLMEEMSVTSWL